MGRSHALSALRRMWTNGCRPEPVPPQEPGRRPGLSSSPRQLYKTLDKILMRRAEADLQQKWSPKTVGFRPGHQASEAHAAVVQALSHGREYGAKVAIAKIDFKKAFDMCCLAKVHEAASRCTSRRDEIDLLIRSHLDVPCTVELDGQTSSTLR